MSQPKPGMVRVPPEHIGDVLAPTKPAKPKKPGPRAQLLAARAEIRRLRAITQDKRDLLAICEQLQDDVERLESQAGDYWKHMHDSQVGRKRETKARLDRLVNSLRELHDALLQNPAPGPVTTAGVLLAFIRAVGDPIDVPILHPSEQAKGGETMTTDTAIRDALHETWQAQQEISRQVGTTPNELREALGSISEQLTRTASGFDPDDENAVEELYGSYRMLETVLFAVARTR